MGNHPHLLPITRCKAFHQCWAVNSITGGKHLFVLSTCCGCFAETHCCCTTCLGPGLAPASPHLCWQGISCALRQISKQPCSLLRSTSGKRYCFMFSVTLAMVGRERKHGNCHNRARSNFDSRRRGTK